MAGIDKVKILVLGDSGVGKTSLVHLMCQNEPTTNPSWTIGCSVDVKLHDYKAGTAAEKTYFVELWDIGGCTGHQNSRTIFYNPVNGIILVHDLTNRKSQHNLRSWLAEVLRKDNKSAGNGYDYDPEEFAGNQVPLLVIGTKADQAENMRDKGKSRSSSVAEEFGADQFDLDCQNVKYLAPGSTNAVKLSRFFDKVIERRHYSREKVDRRLENIETQVYKQNDRINSLEKSVKLIHAQNKLEPQDNETKTKFSSGENDNFINHVKAELRNAAVGTVGEGKSRSTIKKTSSFNESSSRVKQVRVKRSPHTVPSDKDEERRLNSFRRECLSKAIQWNIVDLVNAMPESHFVLPKWLSREEAKSVMEGTERKNHFRRFLCILRKKDFETMQGWLHNCGFHAKALRQVWETFEEFSDKDINRSRLKCFQCRLIENVSVVNVADYLYSADILTSDQEYLRVASSERPVGAQDELWRYVLQECKKYICSDMVAIALKVALTDCMNLADEKLMYESLLTDINVSDTQELLACSCSVRCSQSLHPPSCLKTMSLAGVYFSPPTQRKRESSSSEGPLSSFSSGSSVETVCNSTIEEKIDRNEDTLSLDDETHLKQPIAITDDNRKSDVNRNVAKFSHRTESVRTRSARRRMSQRKVENVPSDSSLENLERENEKVRNSYKSLTCKLENKPTVMPVRANNVYINTGPKYIQLGKGRSSESSSEI